MRIDRRPLIVGQAPNRSGDRTRPMLGLAGRKIAALMGIELVDYLRLFERTNVLDRWPGRRGKGDDFPIDAARASAAKILVRVIKSRPLYVLIVGKSTARAFGIDHEYFSRVSIQDVPFWVMPHPSGINRWWNEIQNRLQAQSRLAILGREALIHRFRRVDLSRKKVSR